jgi:DtxR family Mn-dependent transcriptional regulator
MQKTQKDRLSSSIEDYLEKIAILEKEKGFARVKEISRLLHVKNPSVTSALGNLERKDLVRHEKYGYVGLTEKGKKLANTILTKHRLLFRFLTRVLCIDATIAENDACMLEHSISPETYERLTKFLEFVETCPEDDTPEWLKNFSYYLETGKRRNCKKQKIG